MLRLMKVGLEFEFNLPDQRGTCKGEEISCPCIHMGDGCWRDCEHLELCANTPTRETCENDCDECASDDCSTCANYKFGCIGVLCTEFTSVCINVCERFEKSCNNCNKKYNPEKDPAAIRRSLTDLFNPTNDYTKVNKSGVVSITKDGSLKGDGGMEIITVGRRINYWEFFNMASAILKESGDRGAYLNERCGSHMHLLTTYYENNNDGNFITELEKKMPEIILANFHQLCRRYQNAISWMTMALDDPNHMTRWEKFRVSILDISAIQRDMLSLRDKVADKSGGRKYGWVNYNQMRFDRAGDITAFHVEMRGADSTMCPSYYAAIACLYVALTIKAVDISRYGVLKITDGKDGWLKKAKEAKKAVLNNTGGYDGPRASNTNHVMNFRDYYIEEGMDMLSQLKGTLMKLGPAYEVLTKLIQRPPAVRRCNGDTWEDIEREIAAPVTQSNIMENKLQEIIDLCLIEECANMEEWVQGATNILIEEWGEEIGPVTQEEVKEFTELKMRDGLAIWSQPLGGVIAV